MINMNYMTAETAAFYYGVNTLMTNVIDPVQVLLRYILADLSIMIDR
jgi:hypothetical protein